jgi:hypothetical protein
LQWLTNGDLCVRSSGIGRAKGASTPHTRTRGTADADATSFTLSAAAGDPHYSIGENRYLAENASTLSYVVTVTANPDGMVSYDEKTMLKMREFEEPFGHTDHNTLHRVG